MKKIILSLFIFISCFYINTISVLCEETQENSDYEFIENEVTEEIEFSSLYRLNNSASTYSLLDNYEYTDLDFLNVATYSPIINAWAQGTTSSSSTRYYVGNRPLLFYKSYTRVYTNGNWLIDNFDTVCYNYVPAQYYIDTTDNVFYLYNGTLSATTAHQYYNCYYSSVTSDSDAANLARNTDLSTNSDVISYYNISEAQPFVDASDYKDNSCIVFDETGVTLDSSKYNAYYVDYLYSKDTAFPYVKPVFRRQYFYNFVDGSISWDEFEKKLSGARDYDKYGDNVLILGVGTFKYNGTASTTEAPNQQSLELLSWGYKSFCYDDYTDIDVYENETFASNVVGVNTILASTTQEELKNNTNDSIDNASDNESNNKIIAFFQKVEDVFTSFTNSLADLLDSICNLFTSIIKLFDNFSVSLSKFANVISSCFNWLPSEFVSIVKVVLLGASVILLVKAIKLFL